ncbi:hypothetical protein Tco_0589212, partial [Tanacetum coccineum]
ADYAGCKDTFKSTSDGAQFLGEKLVSWSSKKQDCTTLSTLEAEYVSLSACSIAISCNPVQHSRTKHIAVRYHFIKEHVEKGTIELYFVKTDYQLADLFTKDLLVDRFNYLVHLLGIRSGAGNEFVHDFYDQPPQPQFETYSCELCGNDSHYGFDCPPQFSLVYEQDPSYNQNFSDNYYPQNSSSFPQQYLCCENCGGPHESFQCQPMNQNYFEPDPSYSGFDQPPQYSINHQEDLNQQGMNDVNDKWDKLEESQNELLNMVRSFCEMVIQQKQVANISTYTLEPSRRYNYEDDDDDEEYSIPLNKMPQILWSIAIASVSSIMEPRTLSSMANAT